MKKYTNRTNDMLNVQFSDGTVQFLRRGQSIESDKPVKKVQDGIRVTDVKKIKRPVAQETEDLSKKQTKEQK